MKKTIPISKILNLTYFPLFFTILPVFVKPENHHKIKEFSGGGFYPIIFFTTAKSGSNS